MENNERPSGNLLPEKDTRIQLVVNNTDDEDMIDLGRVLHNAKHGARVFSWVLVFCILVGVSAPLLLYQFQKPELTVTSVVSLRFELPEDLEDVEELQGLLVDPEGKDLDLSVVTSSPVLQKAMEGLTLSKPVTLENIRNNMTVTRVLTEESSRTKEALAGLAGVANNVEAYNRLENTEMKYQNRFIVSLTNGFGDEEDRVKYDLRDEELRILLNRILDAYNDALVLSYADVRLPEDKISLIDTEEMDLPEILDSLSSALDSLQTYCENQPDTARAYRSWQTGLSLNEWLESISTVRSVNIEYLEAYIYSRGIMRDKDAVALTYRYRIRTLQSDLDKVNDNITTTDGLLKSYKNDEVYISMQESDSSRTTKMTTEYYNELVLQQQENYVQAATLRTELAETQNKLERLSSSTRRSEIKDAEAEMNKAIEAVKNLYTGIREHMTELFASPIFTTYSEHSAPQGKLDNFLAASWKKMLIGGIVGAVIAFGCWFLAALAPELKHMKDDDDPKADAEGKEAAKA